MERRDFLVGLGLGALVRQERVSDEQSDWKVVATPAAAYRIGAIEPLLTKKVIEISEAPRGRWVLLHQDLRPSEGFDPGPGEQKLWLYDALRQRTTLVHRLQADPTHDVNLDDLCWFPQSPQVVLTLRTRLTVDNDKYHEPEKTFGLYDTERAHIRWLTPPSTNFYSPNPLPGTDHLLFRGMIIEPTQCHEFVCFLSPNGVFSPVVALSRPYIKDGSRDFQFAGLSADKKSTVFKERTTTISDGKLVGENWFSIGINDAKVIALKEMPKNMITLAELASPKPPLTLQRDIAKVVGGAGRKARTMALWLDATPPRADKRFSRGLVTTETNGDVAADIVYPLDKPLFGYPKPVLLPDLTAILFPRDGAVYVAPLTRLSAELFSHFNQSSARDTAIRIWDALLAFAKAHQDLLPDNQPTWKAAIAPYLRDPELVSDFVYTYKGQQNTTKLANPKAIALGYVVAADGQLWLYLDGSSQWKPDRRPVNEASPTETNSAKSD